MVKMSMVYRGVYPNLVCCQAIVREMPNGEFVVFFQTGGVSEPHPDNRIFISRSKDRGETWSKPEQLFELDGKAIMTTEIMVQDNEVTAFLYTHNGHFMNWENWYCKSPDSGNTWGEIKPMPCLSHRSIIRNLVIKQNGEWVLPYQHYEIGDEEEYKTLIKEGKRFMDSKTAKPENGILISADRGKTWEKYGHIDFNMGQWIWNENNAVELSNGHMAMLIRSGKGFLYRADSPDGGKTWGSAYPTDIPNPSSKIRILKLRDGRIVLIHNPNSLSTFEGRYPLSLWISNDDMKSWYIKQDVVTFPGSHSYPDGFVDEAEGCIHFTFDYNRHDVIYVRVPV